MLNFGETLTFSAMEQFWNKALPVINRMIVDISPVSFSVKRGDGAVDIRLEIQPDPKLPPEIKKKKPSPSRLRRNQKRMLLFLERNRATLHAEPDNSGIISVDAGISQVLTGVLSTPVTRQGDTVLSAIQSRESADTQENDDHTEEGDDSLEDNSSEGEEDNSSEDTSSEGEVDSDHSDGSEFWNKIDRRLAAMFGGTKEMMLERRRRKAAEIEVIPTEEEEPTPGSPDVASSTLPTMNVDNLDRTVKDMILPSTVKIPSKLMEESLKSRQFVKVTRKGRKKNLHDPNSCKTN